MATHHRDSGSPLNGDIDVTRETQKTADTNIENTLTREIDDLCQQVQDGE